MTKTAAKSATGAVPLTFDDAPVAAPSDPTGPQAFAGTGGPSVTIAPVVQVGGEILVNTTRTGNQAGQTITALADGRFVVTWADYLYEDFLSGEYILPGAFRAQIFTSAGAEAGPEILISSPAEPTYSSAPRITALPDGGFVVTWLAYNGTDQDVWARVYDAEGDAVGDEFLVNTTTASDQFDPRVTALSEGGFVMTWAEYNGAGPDASGYAVRAQVFSDLGVKVGDELLVNTLTAGDQYEHQITALSEGGFVITWTDGSRTSPDDSLLAVRAQVFAANGEPVETEILVNTTTDSFQFQPVVTALLNGGFVVAWRDDSQTDPDMWESAVRAQVFSARGSAVGAEFVVNTTTDGGQRDPQITALANGGFVITWLDDSIRAQVFSASGDPVESEIVVNTTTSGNHVQPQIIALADGGFVITWTNLDGYYFGADSDVRAQVFSATGAMIGTEILVNTTTSGRQEAHQIAALPQGGFVVTWTDKSATGLDTDGAAVRAQMFNVGLNAVEQTELSLKNRGFTVSDPDSDDVLTVTLSVDYGVLTVTAGTSGATVADSGTSSVTLTGTASQIDALLNGDATSTVTYTADTDTPPASATVTFAVNDGAGGTATTQAPIAIKGTPDATPPTPLIGGLSETVTFGETLVNGGAQRLDGDVQVDAAQLPADLEGWSLTISGLLAEDRLGFTSDGLEAGQVSLVNGVVLFGGTAVANLRRVGNDYELFNVGAGVGTFTPEALEALFEQLVYSNGSNDPTASRTLTFTLTDTTNTVRAAPTVTVNVTPEDEAVAGPGMTGLARAVTFAESAVNAAPAAFAADVVVSEDSDFATGVLRVSGLSSEDVVAIAETGGITVTGLSIFYQNVQIGVIDHGAEPQTFQVLLASATAEAVQALARALTYSNASDTPTASRDLTVTLLDTNGLSASAPRFSELTGADNPFADFHLSLSPDHPNLSLVDADNDGLVDLIFSSSNFSPADFFRNLTGEGLPGQFASELLPNNPFAEVEPSSAQTQTNFDRLSWGWVDLNGDGSLDIVTTGGGGLDLGYTTNAPPDSSRA